MVIQHGHALHLPRRQRPVPEIRPAGLIDPDDRTGPKQRKKRVVGRLEQVRDRRALIPQRLRCDLETVVRHQACLTLQRRCGTYLSKATLIAKRSE